ncbi:CDP-diacylglycerol--glycerol-3-phosphate 3-phosphatidyltransferase [Alphaproteobacteria bacterium]|nr:CDP-diacylglycerol--glycerol-3-phosphate 3-phosphatidyltransferase [Alphaproteobacteria bacterium]
MKNLPNILTNLRLASPLYFLIIILIFEDHHLQSLLLFFTFIILSFTDYLDGLLARKLNTMSVYGKVFDPISDKILTSSALLFLSSINHKILLPSILIIFREFFISGIREFSLIKRKKNVNVSGLSKLKTAMQFIVISALLALFSIKKKLFLNIELNIEILVNFCIFGLWIVTLLTIYTGFQYCYKIYK